MEHKMSNDLKICDTDTNNCNNDTFRISNDSDVNLDSILRDDRSRKDFGAQDINSSNSNSSDEIEIVDTSTSIGIIKKENNASDDFNLNRSTPTLKGTGTNCPLHLSLGLYHNSIPSNTAVMDETQSITITKTKNVQSTTTNQDSEERSVDNDQKPTILSHDTAPLLSKNEEKISEKEQVEQVMISTQNITYPRVNCPEKIIICLDLNEEMDSTIFKSRAGDKYSGLELAKRTIKMFVMHKTQMNPKHEFAFLIFYEDATMIQNFTSRAQDILNTLDESVIETHKSGPLSLSHLFETIQENVELPSVQDDPEVVPPPYIVRVILVFGRSQCVPTLTSTQAKSILESSPYFFTDVLYIHEPPSEENKCEEIFHSLCELDHSGLSYIFEHSKYTQILNSGAKLLSHPLQRPRQMEAMYKIVSLFTKEDNC